MRFLYHSINASHNHLCDLDKLSNELLMRETRSINSIDALTGKLIDALGE